VEEEWRKSGGSVEEERIKRQKPERKTEEVMVLTQEGVDHG
jgi:hypothetical protein